MKARPFLACRRERTVRKMVMDKRFPTGALGIAPIQTASHKKTDGTTHVGAGHRIVREGIRTIAVILMALDLGKQTAHMLAQRVIKHPERVRFWTAHRFRLLEQRFHAPIIDAVLEPRRFGEEAAAVGFISTVQHATGEVGETFGVQADQTRQVMLEMLKRAPMHEEIAKERRMGGHDGSRGYNGQLHETFALSPKGGHRA